MNYNKDLLEELDRIEESMRAFPEKEIDVDFELELRGTQDDGGIPCFTPTGYRIVTIKYYLP